MSNKVDVLCAGIVVADHVSSPISHLPAAGELVLADDLILTIGGCAANVAVDLVKLGMSATVVGRVGADVFGRVVADMLGERHVDVSGLQVSPEQPTSQTMIVNVKGQDRRFIHTFGANASFQASDISRERIQQCRVLYLGGYLLMAEVRPEELAEVFQFARAAGVKTILDVVTPGPGNYLPQLQAVLPHVDVFLPNDHEAGLITGESDAFAQAERFQQMGVATTIITQGERGCVYVGPGGQLQAEAYRVPFVDGTGGGDAFAAGYIAGLLRGLAPEDCLRTASAVGASCVQAIGTTTGVFTQEQLQTFLTSNAIQIKQCSQHAPP
jgi:sugar/nucleoside kinase (ribokinase family)